MRPSISHRFGRRVFSWCCLGWKKQSDTEEWRFLARLSCLSFFLKSTSSSHKMDFKEQESSRPPFESHPLKLSKTPAPEWKVGQGLNSHPQADLFHHQATFKSIKPNETEISAFDMYKIMITGIVSQDGSEREFSSSFFESKSEDKRPLMFRIRMFSSFTLQGSETSSSSWNYEQAKSAKLGWVVEWVVVVDSLDWSEYSSFRTTPYDILITQRMSLTAPISW